MSCQTDDVAIGGWELEGLHDSWDPSQTIGMSIGHSGHGRAISHRGMVHQNIHSCGSGIRCVNGSKTSERINRCGCVASEPNPD
jgi:hypothetical protein